MAYRVRTPPVQFLKYNLVASLLLFTVMISILACGESTATSTVIQGDDVPPAHEDAAPPSLEHRIYYSDVVVRASLLSSGDDLLRFTAIEYLKGSGASEFTVRASTVGRNTTWDEREALLFLTISDVSGNGASGQTGNAEFVFTDATHDYWKGDQPEGYTIGSRDPVWLPAEEASGAGGASGDKATFITDDEQLLPDFHSTTVSLGDLRKKVAWIEGGEGVEGYDKCIRSSLDYIRHFRDYETYYGQPWTPYMFTSEIRSGAVGGLVVADYGPFRGTRGYNRLWLTGTDADLFSHQVVDADETSTTGYRASITTTRPLAAGSYRFFSHIHDYAYMPCNFPTPNHLLDRTVNVTAPEDTLHEAFFDPVTIGSGVGIDGSNGALHPAQFSIGGTTTSMTGLTWENGTVVLTLIPHVSLVGKGMEVIELDGSVSLTLDFDDATENTGAGTYSWSVAEQPWDDGDLLMLRMRD